MSARLPGGKPQPRGLWIAFFGPDGAGKSAVIEQLKIQLRPFFSGILQFHFRPRFGHQRLGWPPVTNPHSQKPRGWLISVLKLIYWLLDCWYGYWLAIRPARRTARLVIFDRYYPDILVDPCRYRLPTNCLHFARWLVTLAPRPDLCILLDAPAEVVQRRKAEISPAESQRQRLAYRAMLQVFPGMLIVNADCPANEVAQQVSAAVQPRLSGSPVQQDKGFVLADL